MQELRALFEYNVWANRKVFELTFDLDPRLVEAQAPGTRDSVGGTLRHLARVEYAYLSMIEQRPPESIEPRESYEAHDLAWFRAHMEELGAAYQALIASMPAAELDRALHIPWFDFPLTARDGLLQVLSHSAQHRSQVLAWLSARGVTTPDLDYVLMVGERHATARLA
jgi:uncharacterized damage-inducible protein DinB